MQKHINSKKSNSMNNKKTSTKINNINTNFVTVSPSYLATLNKLLTNVTNVVKNRQLLSATCFIIHVGLECIGEHAYA